MFHILYVDIEVVASLLCECSEQELLCFWCLFHNQYGRVALAFQQKLLCLKMGIFLTKQKLSDSKLFLHIRN